MNSDGCSALNLCGRMTDEEGSVTPCRYLSCSQIFDKTKIYFLVISVLRRCRHWFILNVRKRARDTASCPERTNSSTTPMWKPKNLAKLLVPQGSILKFVLLAELVRWFCCTVSRRCANSCTPHTAHTAILSLCALDRNCLCLPLSPKHLLPPANLQQ